jgi:FixJ family two-component response regulator
MSESEAVVAIVDDDPWALDGLQRLIRSAGWTVETFASAQEFLALQASRSLRVWSWTCNCLG